MNDKRVENNNYHNQTFLIFVQKCKFLEQSSLFILFYFYILYLPKSNYNHGFHIIIFGKGPFYCHHKKYLE